MEGGAGRSAGRPGVRNSSRAPPGGASGMGCFYPDGSRVIRSKMTGRKTNATLLPGEASRLERLTRTATATNGISAISCGRA